MKHYENEILMCNRTYGTSHNFRITYSNKNEKVLVKKVGATFTTLTNLNTNRTFWIPNSMVQFYFVKEGVC